VNVYLRIYINHDHTTILMTGEEVLYFKGLIIKLINNKVSDYDHMMLR